MMIVPRVGSAGGLPAVVSSSMTGW